MFYMNKEHKMVHMVEGFNAKFLVDKLVDEQYTEVELCNIGWTDANKVCNELKAKQVAHIAERKNGIRCMNLCIQFN